MEIRQTTTPEDKLEVDWLLWEVLWEPLGFPSNIRDSFKLDKPQIDLIAVENGTVVGALVANWLSDNEIEIRHIAVRQDYQGKSVGTLLVKELYGLVQRKTPLTVKTHARNTSVGFFSKLGFISSGSQLYIKEFTKHGIWIQPMLLEI